MLHNRNLAAVFCHILTLYRRPATDLWPNRIVDRLSTTLFDDGEQQHRRDVLELPPCSVSVDIQTETNFAILGPASAALHLPGHLAATVLAWSLYTVHGLASL